MQTHTHTLQRVASKRHAPNAAPLLWSLSHERASSEEVDDIKKGEEEHEDQNYHSSKAAGAKPQQVSPPFVLCLPPSLLTPHEAGLR